MKYHVNIKIKDFAYEGDIEGSNAEAVVLEAKKAAAPKIIERLPKWQRGFAKRKIAKMSEVAFAGEVIKAYNKEFKTKDPTPKTCDEFLLWAKSKGYITEKKA